MYCPFCGHIETKVTDSRLAGEGRQIRRRRECLSCEERFTTFETAELVMPVVVKGDRNRESFDEAKLRAGMEKALEKRPVPREQLDEALSRITHKVRSLGDREVQSRAIGELVMDELRQLDEVAYVRFASVYRHFEDVEAFHEEIQRLRSQRSPSQPVREIKRVLKREPGPNRDQLPLLPMESPGKTESSGATRGSGATESPGAAKNAAATESADDSGNEVAAGRSLVTENK
jgi:transcriptional repressor NrdR